MTESRTYESPRRKKQAEETRQAILAAARELFANRGYAATPLTDIAAEAGVSVPTLYASVGSKAAIALALVAFVNEQVDMRSLDMAQDAATSGPELIRAIAHLVRTLNEQAGDLIRVMTSAALVEPDLVPVAAAGRQMHREGQRVNAKRLAQLGALREDMSEERAAAILATQTAYEVFTLMVVDEGWTYDAVEEWLAETLSRMLLPPESVQSGKGRPGAV